MKFKEIELIQWQQFEKIGIDFSKRLTVITGANGNGKTTILSILAKHCSWERPSLGVPKKDKESGIIKFFARLFKGVEKKDSTIGHIKYSDNNTSEINIPIGDDIQSYNIEFSQLENVECIFIPAHRSIFRYQQMSSLPLQKKNKRSAYEEVANIERNNYLGYGDSTPTSFCMKNSLISWAINGYGVKKDNSKVIMQSDEEQQSFFEGFQTILRKVLPKTLGFQELEIRNMEIVLICNDGNDEFLLESVSGGISAIIDLAWQIYMYDVGKDSEFTVIVDEIENHLHPSMQRSILSDFMEAFPNVSFIVSTHSPLLVNSVKDANVYALRYNESKKVISEKLDIANDSKTANEILTEVLGISTTYPIWVEEAYNSIIRKFESEDVSAESIAELKKCLKEIGLEKIFMYTLSERVSK